MKLFIFAYDGKAIPLVFCAKIDKFEDDKIFFLNIFFNSLKNVQGYNLSVFAKKLFIFAYDGKAIPLVFCAKIDKFEDDKKKFLNIFFQFFEKSARL